MPRTPRQRATPTPYLAQQMSPRLRLRLRPGVATHDALDALSLPPPNGLLDTAPLGVQGTWDGLADNNVTIRKWPWSIFKGTKAVASGHLTQQAEIYVKGKMLDLKKVVNEGQMANSAVRPHASRQIGNPNAIWRPLSFALNTICCPCSATTFAMLCTLHTVLGDTLADIEAVYLQNSTPLQQQREREREREHGAGKGRNALATVTKSIATSSVVRSILTTGGLVLDRTLSTLDSPAPDAPYDVPSPAEQLTAQPRIVTGINRIVAAAGYMAAMVQVPFFTLCDARMGGPHPRHREGPPDGVDVREIAKRTEIDVHKLAHLLHLLATHHLLRETAPDVIARNRISSLVESGKRIGELFSHGNPLERKYDDMNGIAAFTPSCDALYFTLVDVPWCGWLEGEEGWTDSAAGSTAGGGGSARARTQAVALRVPAQGVRRARPKSGGGASGKHLVDRIGMRSGTGTAPQENLNHFRLERFGKVVAGTGSWDAPGAVFQGFDWVSFPRGVLIVDVGGRIGSTRMLRVSVHGDAELRFVIQGRPVVVEMRRRPGAPGV
ncbi:hypothetical protein C8J57DRAFT_1714149, partial [Mycena rebaudengoi]